MLVNHLLKRFFFSHYLWVLGGFSAGRHSSAVSAPSSSLAELPSVEDLTTPSAAHKSPAGVRPKRAAQALTVHLETSVLGEEPSEPRGDSGLVPRSPHENEISLSHGAIIVLRPCDAGVPSVCCNYH